MHSKNILCLRYTLVFFFLWILISFLEVKAVEFVDILLKSEEKIQNRAIRVMGIGTYISNVEHEALYTKTTKVDQWYIIYNYK